MKAPAVDELRLLPADGPLDLRAHLDRHGPPPFGDAGRLVDAVERSGLTGRGGAAFPAGRKLRAVALAAPRGGAVVVANGSESEPASSKDAVLLATVPHLVLDGIALAAAAVGAARAYLCVGERTTGLPEAVTQRDRAGLNRVPIQVTTAPSGYLAGQETALISALNGGAARPTFVPPWPATRGAHRRPTLVLNVETLAHVALIARYGPEWFREIGTPATPGSALVTVSGAVTRPGVYEIPLGLPLRALLERTGVTEAPQAVLTGGYFGSWLALPAGVGLSPPALGPGVLAVLPRSCCGLAETARVTGYLASQTARQCGPCTNGMPALAEAMNWIAFGRPTVLTRGGDPPEPPADLVGWAQELTRLIAGRGACHLPDGAAALVASALQVFGTDAAAHAAGGPCERAGRPPLLPLPSLAAS